MRELTYFIGVSMDGFIAGPDHEVEGFDVGPELLGHIIERYPETLPTPAREALGLSEAVNQRFDAVLMGRHTYEIGRSEGLTNPYGHMEQVVLSSSLGEDSDRPVTVTSEDPSSAVEALKTADGLGIWLCGGGLLAGSLIDLIDEVVLKRYPVIFGSGRPLFDSTYEPQRFELVEREEVGGTGIETFRPTDR